MYEPSWAVLMALLYGNVLDLDSGGNSDDPENGTDGWLVVPRNEKLVQNAVVNRFGCRTRSGEEHRDLYVESRVLVLNRTNHEKREREGARYAESRI